jgi:hypothetical protein
MDAVETVEQAAPPVVHCSSDIEIAPDRTRFLAVGAGLVTLIRHPPSAAMTKLYIEAV